MFFFNSLADLASGRPASFTRVLSASLRNSSRTGTALYVGDAVTRWWGLEMDYGLRLEGSRYGDAPPAETSRRLGVRAVDRSTFRPRWPESAHWLQLFAAGDRKASGDWRLRGGVGEFRGIDPDRDLRQRGVIHRTSERTAPRYVHRWRRRPRPTGEPYLADPSSIPHYLRRRLGSVNSPAAAERRRLWGGRLSALRTWRGFVRRHASTDRSVHGGGRSLLCGRRVAARNPRPQPARRSRFHAES